MEQNNNNKKHSVYVYKNNYIITMNKKFSVTTSTAPAAPNEARLGQQWPQTAVADSNGRQQRTLPLLRAETEL